MHRHTIQKNVVRQSERQKFIECHHYILQNNWIAIDKLLRKKRYNNNIKNNRKKTRFNVQNELCTREHVHNHHYPRNVSANFIITHYRLHVKIAHGINNDLHTKTQLPDTLHIYIYIFESLVILFRFFPSHLHVIATISSNANNWIEAKRNKTVKCKTPLYLLLHSNTGKKKIEIKPKSVVTIHKHKSQSKHGIDEEKDFGEH